VRRTSLAAALSATLIAASAGASAQVAAPATPAAAPAAAPPPPPPRDAANASFWQRWDNIGPDPLHSPYEWYQPKAKLAGAPQPWLPEVRAPERVFSVRTLDAAAQYAEHTNGQALIVLQGGKVQLVPRPTRSSARIRWRAR
jgi:hypothetical protein